MYPPIEVIRQIDVLLHVTVTSNCRHSFKKEIMMAKVINNIFIFILLAAPFDTYADDADAARRLSKQEILQYLPEDMNLNISRNGGRIYIEPGTYLINVKGTDQNIEYTYQHPINEMASMISRLKGISNSEAKALIKTQSFKDDWINNTIRKRFVSSNCTSPLYKEILNKGITIVYHYQYDNNEKVGSLSIDKAMCK